MKPTDTLSIKLSKVSNPSHFTLTFGSGMMLQGRKCMLIGTVQKPTLGSYDSKNQLLFTPLFSETLPVERLEVMIKVTGSKMNSKDLQNF
jgi:hypothetical protein